MLCYILIFCALLCWCICLSCVFDSVCELVGEQFAMCLGVVAILLLNIMNVFSVGALLDRPCMVFQRMHACCACDPSVHLSVTSIGIVCVFCMSEVLSLCCFFVGFYILCDRVRVCSCCAS